MSVFEIFSKRQKRERGEVPDVYQYEIIPQPLRVQIVHILRDALDEYNQYSYEIQMAIIESGGLGMENIVFIGVKLTNSQTST